MVNGNDKSKIEVICDSAEILPDPISKQYGLSHRKDIYVCKENKGLCPNPYETNCFTLILLKEMITEDNDFKYRRG